ncbi:hypothetical protein GCM10009839_64860 [Catenulispora yoronensis]|uniref:ABC transporter permease n=1 Tax=Catenulispora yoronensis TaxID=450799 RepID=A0ABN2V3Y2_9ACTN
MSPTEKALRIQTLKLRQTFALPWFSLMIAILMVAAIFGVAHQVPYDKRVTGALTAFYLSGIGMQPWLINQVFPFAMALSVTRGAFIRATAAIIFVEAVVAGAGLTVLSRLETATHGWFVHTRLLNLPHVHQDNVFSQFLVYGVPMAVLSTTMACVAAVFRAFGQIGLWVFAVATAVLAALTIIVLTLTHAGGSVVHFFGSQPMLADFALYPLALVALFGTGWVLLMKRARV